jgi:hypothetical protein
MAVLPSGNVGIGTTEPGANVTMVGGLAINGGTTSQNGGITTQFVISKDSSPALAVNVSESAAGDVNFYDHVNGNFNKALALSGGAVTIGPAESAPQHSLNTAVGTPGSGSATITNLPDGVSTTPAGYIKMSINGVDSYIPYFQ